MDGDNRLMKITIKPTVAKEEYEVYKRDSSTWNSVKEELTFDVNVSSGNRSWRLVHWNSKVIELFESEGYTRTINHLFEGTEKQCLAEIDRLKLKHGDIEDAKIQR